MIQITFIQIDNFGPFTEEMGDNREHKIQILLSEVFILLQKSFNQYGGLVFSASKDNMLAVTNGISIVDHQKIIEEIERDLPITVSMGIGIGRTPLEAQIEASKVLISQGSAQSSRKKVLAYNGHKIPVNDQIKAAHLDINFYTKVATDVHPFYHNYINLNKSYLTLMEAFQEIGGLCFFNGGDNFICVCPESMEASELEPIIERYEKNHTPWKLKAGLGEGNTILQAITKANVCLKEIRERNNIDKIKVLL